MAESVSDAGKGLTVVALTATTGGDFSISISSESVQGAENLVGIVCVTAVACFGLYAVYQLRKAEIDAAVKIALGGNRSDQEIVDTKEGSLVVVLHCKTDGRFLEILEDYETGRMRERFEREFSKIEGIKVHGLKVEISNMDEVMKTKEDIKKRYVHTQMETKTEKLKFSLAHCIVVLVDFYHGAARSVIPLDHGRSYAFSRSTNAKNRFRCFSRSTINVIIKF